MPTAPAAALSEGAVLDDPLELSRFTRWLPTSAGPRLAESNLALSGMHCAACAGLIEQALLGVPGVVQARVSAAGQRATVQWNPARAAASRLIAAVQAAGYGAAPDTGAPARELRAAEARAAVWRLFVAGLCAMQVMMLAAPAYFAAPGDLAPDLARLLNWASWLLSLPVLLFSAAPLFSAAWQGLRQRRISMDLPVALGLGVSFVASTGATFQSGGLFGSEVYFDSLTMFVSFLLAARYVEMRLRHRAVAVLEAATGELPHSAWRRTAAGTFEEVSALRVRPGDVLRVPLGQAFVADGVVIEGQTRSDEALLSGESRSLPRGPGDEVLAGSLNAGAPVLMRVQRSGADTRLQAVLSLMRSAATQRPAEAALAERMAGPFLWAVLGLAVAAALVWSQLDPARAVWVAVSVLVVTCPCALALATPATLIAAAQGLAQRGVLVRRLDALERLARVDSIVLDKTGTLCEPQPVLKEVSLLARLHGVVDAASARQLASGLAAYSQHPLSRALAAAGAPGGVWFDVQEHPGCGLSARDKQGCAWRLGAAHWAAYPAPTRGGGPHNVEDDFQVLLARAGQPLAAFSFEETLRPGAQQAVQALQEAGVALSLLSGDAPARVRALATRLGLAVAMGGATPAAKLAEMARMQAQGRRVAMVGDGINDAPVLARADVAMAIGQGALAARSVADFVLLAGRPLDVVLSRNVARKATRIVRQNLLWAATYNAACVPAALAGYLPPWAAGLGMALSSLFVVLNAARAAH